jgi:hypothetical protein
MSEFSTGKKIEAAEMKPAPEPDYSNMEGFEEIAGEYDCGKPCTPDGCPGHEGHPIGFWLDGISFYVEGAEAGDFPSGHATTNRRVREVLGKLAEALEPVEMTVRDLDTELKEQGPAGAYIEWTCPHGRTEKGVALSLGENLTRLWQSGDVIVFWENGDHTMLFDERGGDIRPEHKVKVRRLFAGRHAL